jgi:thymidylate synthase (FAD)
MTETKRTTVAAAEALLGIRVPVLDHGGVTPISYMGGDADVLRAARTTSGIEGKGAAEDRALLRFLLRHRHTTPFEFCEVSFLCEMPIAVARQWIRHRTASVNEFSQRYSDPPEESYVPAPEHVAAQSAANRQGRGGVLDPDDAELARRIIGRNAEQCRAARGALADLGVARELSRVVLPVGGYTRWAWKIDLHNLMHFLGLRLDPHAQLEIRLFAAEMASFVRAWVPECWAAFEEYRLLARAFGASERRALRLVAAGGSADGAAAAAQLRGREREEFLAKLEPTEAPPIGPGSVVRRRPGGDYPAHGDPRLGVVRGQPWSGNTGQRFAEVVWAPASSPRRIGAEAEAEHAGGAEVSMLDDLVPA